VRLALLASAAGAVVTLVLVGCGTGGFVDDGSQSAGKPLFQQRCGSCHVLADAGTAGTIGPNLDDAFAQSRADGMTNATFTQVVAGQIRFPITQTSTGAPGMPGPNGAQGTLPKCEDVEEGAFCVEDQDQAIADVATYVGAVAGTGAEPAPPGGGEADGKSIFASTCASCHTLADAGATGTVGPNLDESRPPRDLVVDRVTNGQGAMPSFQDSLSPEQIQAVADYVSSAAGG
jgi:mono/diheme cytochrome c family protein